MGFFDFLNPPQPQQHAAPADESGYSAPTNSHHHHHHYHGRRPSHHRHAMAHAAHEPQNPLMKLTAALEQNTHIGHLRNPDGSLGSFNKAPGEFSGYCAANVVDSFQKAGFKIPHADAKDLPPLFEQAGFQKVGLDDYTPVKGDVMFIAPQPALYKTHGHGKHVQKIQIADAHEKGHVAVYDGKNWVSDARQAGMWVYSDRPENKSLYTIMRQPQLAALANGQHYAANAPGHTDTAMSYAETSQQPHLGGPALDALRKVSAGRHGGLKNHASAATESAPVRMGDADIASHMQPAAPAADKVFGSLPEPRKAGFGLSGATI